MQQIKKGENPPGWSGIAQKLHRSNLFLIEKGKTNERVFRCLKSRAMSQFLPNHRPLQKQIQKVDEQQTDQQQGDKRPGKPKRPRFFFLVKRSLFRVVGFHGSRTAGSPDYNPKSPFLNFSPGPGFLPIQQEKRASAKALSPNVPFIFPLILTSVPAPGR